MVEPPEVQHGLQDVVALESRICFIDGKGGRLIYDGYDIRDLAANSTFEEVAYLLWYGRLPTSDAARRARGATRGAARAPRRRGRAVIDRDARPRALPMDVLRTAVSALAVFEPDETRPGRARSGAPSA